uniref:ABC transporter family G domain-containing protein n=1 Tax=Spongospora subterranea TaxID=70186 RepID=A0A0H5QM54_9EUKA|eukprot:CRZ02451.1 hypothetical protein [Spongospora subterranea]
MFDKIVLLSQGQTMFHGTSAEALIHFDKTLKFPCPLRFNPCDHYLSVLNTDFSSDPAAARNKVAGYAKLFRDSDIAALLLKELKEIEQNPGKALSTDGFALGHIRQIGILTERAYKNADLSATDPSLFFEHF